MKHNALLIAIAFLFMGGISVQAQNDTKIGAFLGYGTEIENIGIGANAEFPIIDKLTISPSFLYYFPREEGPVKITWFEVNANANYYFLEDDSFSVYGIGGLNYTSVKVESDFGGFGGFGGDVSDGRFGLNLGGGINLVLDGKFTPFAELKYVIIDGGQLVAQAGVRYTL